MSCPRVSHPSIQVGVIWFGKIGEIVSEPISGSLPKFSSEAKLSLFVRKEKTSMSLLCPAQGFPVPAFRLGKKC